MTFTIQGCELGFETFSTSIIAFMLYNGFIGAPKVRCVDMFKITNTERCFSNMFVLSSYFEQFRMNENDLFFFQELYRQRQRQSIRCRATKLTTQIDFQIRFMNSG